MAAIRDAGNRRLEETRQAFSQAGGLPVSESDYEFIGSVIPFIEASDNPRGDWDRLAAASVYSNNLGIPLENAYLNLEEIHRQYTGASPETRGTLQAAIDSVGYSIAAAGKNWLGIMYALEKDPKEREKIAEVIRRDEAEMERLKDKAPKPWDDAYVSQGAFSDLAALGRGIVTATGENAVSIASAFAVGGAAGMGAKALGAVFPKIASAKAVAGITAAAVGANAAQSVWGITYWEMVDTYGIDDDIAMAHAGIVSLGTGAMETALGGVASAALKNVLGAGFGGALNRAVSKWFVSGKMGSAGKALMEWASEMAEEGVTEGAETLLEGAVINAAADRQNERNMERLLEIYSGPVEETAAWLEEQLAENPEIEGKEAREIFREAWNATLNAVAASVLTGGLAAVSGYGADVKTARVIHDEAKAAKNAADFVEQIRTLREGGLDIPVEKGLSPEDEAAVLTGAYEVIQGRMTAEERAARDAENLDAEALAEVSDYSDSEIVEETAEYGEGEDRGAETYERLEEGDASVYREDGRLPDREYSGTRDDGTEEIRYYAGDTGRAGEDGMAAEYGHITARESGDVITVGEFAMKPRYESLRGEMFRQFAERHAGKHIVWNPKHGQNIPLRDALIQANPRGPGNGLDYYGGAAEAGPGAEARKIAAAITRIAPRIDGREAALVAEAFSFTRRPGESLTQAFDRMGVVFTGDAPPDAVAAQRRGRTVKGAAWAERTAEGMKRFVYVNRHAADASTVAHEMAHVAAMDFTRDDLKQLARGLDGFVLKNGTAARFDAGAITPESFAASREQQEAFAEGLERYLATGNAPNEELAPLFERIKEFMRRLWERLKDWGELSPAADEFYRKLFGGGLGRETGPQSVEEGRGATRGEETGNDTADGKKTVQEAPVAEGREGVITDGGLPLEDRAMAVFDAAGGTLFRDGERAGPVAGTDPPRMENGPLFQEGERDIVEEAASFPTWQEWRDYVNAMEGGDFGEYGAELAGLVFDEAAAERWFKTFHENAVKAVEAANAADAAGAAGAGAAPKRGTPAELDREFLEALKDAGEFDGFLEAARAVHNDGLSGGALTAEDAAAREERSELRGDIQRVFSHPGWQAFFKGDGRIKTEAQRKRLLGLVRSNPRDYRGIYARVTGISELGVSAEDSQAARLRYELGDRLAGNAEGLSPEKLRELAEQIDEDEFAEKVRTGKAKFNEPGEKRYIKEQNRRIAELEEAVKAAEADRKDDDERLGRLVSREFLETFDRAVKLKESLRKQDAKIERAAKRNAEEVPRAARLRQGIRANFLSVTAELQALAKARRLETDVMAALADERVTDALNAQAEEAGAKLKELKREYADYVKSAKTEAALTARLARRAGEQQMRARLEEARRLRDERKELAAAKRGVFARIFREPKNPRLINHEQGRAIAAIQRLFEPSLLDAADRLVNGIETPYLSETHRLFHDDAAFRDRLLEGKRAATRGKIERILGKEKFGDITGAEKKYLLSRLSGDSASELGLDAAIEAWSEETGAGPDRELEALALRYLPGHVYYRILEKPLDSWTLAEGEELAGIIDGIRETGKQIRKANIDAENRRIDAARKAAARAARDAVPERWRDRPEDGEEERERKRKKREALFNRYGAGGTALEAERKRKARVPLFRYNDMDNAHFVEYWLDNGEENGANYAFLVKRARDARDAELRERNRRVEAVMKVFDAEGKKIEDLYQTAVSLDMGGDIGVQSFTRGELMAARLALKNSYSARAVRTGNLLSKMERQMWQDGEMDADEAALLADTRLGLLKDAAARFLDAEENGAYVRIMNAVAADWSENTGRLGSALVRYNNSEMTVEKNYYAMNRTEPVSSHVQNAQLLREMTGSAAGGFQAYVERGMTKDRVKIPEQYQTPISLDLFQVWGKSVEEQEHFIAWGQLVKDANRVYKDPNSAARTWIGRRFGDAGLKRVDRVIDGFVRPEGQRTRTALDETLAGIRRNYAAAVLGWRAVPVVKQFLTSPGAFMAYMKPWEYWAAHAGYITNRAALWDEIRALSPFMKNRAANMIVEEAKQAARYSHGAKGGKLARFNKAGMGALEMVDNITVAPGWLALYRKEKARLTGAAENATLSVEEISVKAARYADSIVEKTQPSGFTEDVAPLFRGNSETGKALLQFQQSLNVVWQQTRYDLPLALRRKLFKQAAGQITGYVMAGLMTGLITAGFDDDDDEAAKAQKIVQWSSSQFTDTIPLLGGTMSDLAETALTGKAPFRRSSGLFPAAAGGASSLTYLIQAFQNADGSKAAKAFIEAAKTAGYVSGAPVQGVLDAGRVAGIGDGEEGVRFRPEALLGRR